MGSWNCLGGWGNPLLMWLSVQVTVRLEFLLWFILKRKQTLTVPVSAEEKQLQSESSTSPASPRSCSFRVCVCVCSALFSSEEHIWIFLQVLWRFDVLLAAQSTVALVSSINSFSLFIFVTDPFPMTRSYFLYFNGHVQTFLFNPV